MEQIAVNNLTFAYDVDSHFSLKNVSLLVNPGEIVLIIGASGCGKTTLLRHLKMDYMPQGKREASGEIRINGKLITELTDRECAQKVGFVGQNVDALQVTDKVWHELAFGLENLGYSQEVMQCKVAEMTAFFGLEGIYHEKLCNLSGGQRQLVNLAAVMAMEPEILVLDEPTSQLDPVAATEFFRMIDKINRELGTTIVMTEHRLEEVFSLCHHVLVMEQGRIVGEGTPQQIVQLLYDKGLSMYRAMPSAARLYLALGERENVPLTVNAGRSFLQTRQPAGAWNNVEETKEHGRKISGNRTKKETGQNAVVADEVWFRYERQGRDILRACSIKVEPGKITAILGGNGAGKSTLLHLLAGKIQAYSGTVKLASEKAGLLPQNPQAMFARKTVLEELASDVSVGKKLNEKRAKELLATNEMLQKVIERCDLNAVLFQHPFDLSGGQMQKLALAKLLLQDVAIFLLDEPGKGMDYAFKEEMGMLLQELAKKGKTILMVSHDVEFCAKYADACGLFFDGHVVTVSDSRSFFLNNTFYTTSVVRMCRGMLPGAVVLEDVLRAFSVSEERTGEGEKESSSVLEERTGEDERESSSVLEEKTGEDERESSSVLEERTGEDERESSSVLEERTREDEKESSSVSGKKTEQNVRETALRHGKHVQACIYAIVLVVMPITIYVGHTVLQQRKYYFISLLLVLEAVAAFFLGFEKRKPRVREIMVVAAFSAIVVAARAAFYMVPNVKPMAALVIIAGVGWGAETGFLVGAMSMLVSNIFFGQGPWTPWQMFVMGLVGFLAGVIFRQDTPCDRKKKYGICVFGFVAVMLVYGGIMNTSTVLMYQEHVNLQMILAGWAMGVPYDAIHAAATFGFLWLGARPMLEKIERIRKKYIG